MIYTADWANASCMDIVKYKNVLDENLSKYVSSSQLLSCSNVNCFSLTHRHLTDELYDSIVKSCINAGNISVPSKMLFKSKVKRIPFWEAEVKPYKEQSLFWHRI